MGVAEKAICKCMKIKDRDTKDVPETRGDAGPKEGWVEVSQPVLARIVNELNNFYLIMFESVDFLFIGFNGLTPSNGIARDRTATDRPRFKRSWGPGKALTLKRHRVRLA